MSAPNEIAERIAGWRHIDASQHPEGLYETVFEWINSEDEEVRHEALLFLGRHLKQLSDAQVILDIVTADPSERMRRSAADALGGIFRNTHDRRVAGVLAVIAQSDSEAGAVRAAALGAIRRINGQRF